MAESSHIEVEVIVWDGIFRPLNPFGHVSTKITKNGIPYSYSLEAEHTPKNVCNTQPFQILRAHEQGLRDGVGFVLNVSQEQAKEIFLTMNTIFTSYDKPGCKYNFALHNCTKAIQDALKKSGVNLFETGIPLLPVTVEHALKKTYLRSTLEALTFDITPSFVADRLLKTKNSSGEWLVKNIIEYKKGEKEGKPVNTNQEKLIFNLKATKNNKGWHSDTPDTNIPFYGVEKGRWSKRSGLSKA